MNELLAVGCDMHHKVMVKFSSDFPYYQLNVKNSFPVSWYLYANLVDRN